MTVTLRGMLEAASEAMVPLTKPVAALMLSPKGRPEALKVSTFPSGSLALSWSPTMSPSALDCAPDSLGVGSAVTGTVTVPGRGGVPLSVTVTAKLCAAEAGARGVYVASPLAVTVAVPLAGVLS